MILHSLRRAILFAAAISCASGAISGADDARKTYRPVAPEREFFKLRHLMGDGMMPNYKALWYGFRRGDADTMRQALVYMAQLTRQSRQYPRPLKVGTEEDFRARMTDLQDQINAFSGDLASISDRSAVSSRILALYKSCQSCHSVYAPAERADERKYSPPTD